MVKTKYQPSTDILREIQLSQFYRYAKKTQISLDPKKYRYVGDICIWRYGKKQGRDDPASARPLYIRICLPLMESECRAA
jgi:hypothetical protein